MQDCRSQNAFPGKARKELQAQHTGKPSLHHDRGLSAVQCHYRKAVELAIAAHRRGWPSRWRNLAVWAHHSHLSVPCSEQAADTLTAQWPCLRDTLRVVRSGLTAHFHGCQSDCEAKARRPAWLHLTCTKVWTNFKMSAVRTSTNQARASVAKQAKRRRPIKTKPKSKQIQPS